MPGDKIIIEGYEDGTADDVLNPKKKVWEKLQVYICIAHLNLNLSFCAGHSIKSLH